MKTSESYKALQTRVLEDEKEGLAKLEGVSKRTYVHSATFTHPTTEPESLPCKYILVVTLEMKTAEAEEDMNRWYDEEHMDLLSKIPGWKQGRRYKLVESNQRGTMADKPVSQYLAIHEFTNSGFASTPEFKHATSTEWRERVMKNADRHARVFELKNKF
ncbi:hypothetical protein R3P38DRAFT_210261 [Favolaschia claudopus]|uniref:Uncharacterized protein n=1 Tax=Favolaschia claudopus TaxID=2862362 RepID=A0AAV9ZUJ4_9AGAR